MGRRSSVSCLVAGVRTGSFFQMGSRASQRLGAGGMQGGRQRLLLWMLAWLWEGIGDRSMEDGGDGRGGGAWKVEGIGDRSVEE